MALPMCAMPCVSVLIPQKYHNWMEVPTKLCLQVTQSELPLSVFHPRPFLLGASGCVSLWPHLPRKTPRNLSSTVAHMMQPLCKLSTTTNRSFYEKTSRLALMVVPVPLPVHSTRASSWVCEYVCVCADLHPVYTARLLLPAVRTWTDHTFSPNLIVLAEVLSIHIFVTNSFSRGKNLMWANFQ